MWFVWNCCWLCGLGWYVGYGSVFFGVVVYVFVCVCVGCVVLVVFVGYLVVWDGGIECLVGVGFYCSGYGYWLF